MAVIPIGLTGGVAEGKTTVLRILAELGFKTASADEIARDVLDDPVVWSIASERLGINGPLDRKVLGRMVACDTEKRRALNKVVHPEVLSRLLELNPDVVEVPLLLEACLQSVFKRIWVVTCGKDEQLRRLTERLGDSEHALKLVSTQLPFPVKQCFADRVIRTDRPISAVVKSVEEIERHSGF